MKSTFARKTPFKKKNTNIFAFRHAGCPLPCRLEPNFERLLQYTVDAGYSSQLGNSDFGYYIERTTITRDYYIERRESTTDFGYYIERFDF